MERVIKRLPDSVRNTMRSGVILFDMTRVVEELVFNSLDAGATKVAIYVGVGTCYVKVVDNGCGISRDGLVLLGERYVTSKLGDLDAPDGSFGFRGEALASISDVSVLEITTKARGRPNGYCKVLKGSKCLYLGVNDDMKDVGTTVVVRDLFYNQPVRRKCMQSSLKKVIDSVKKCILRIAFVHSKVSFKVFDTESEDELLYTHPSSALSLLMSSFGIEDSNVLQKLDVCSGVLKLSGYISGPCDSLIIKAFQYVYINSRFVCKGPIHKLLNHLAIKFESQDPWKANNMPQKGKKCRPQACPAYILNLRCPLDLYDLTFEPSKLHVEFKDWMSILNFIENSILQLWTGNMTYGKSLGHEPDLCRKDEIWKEDLIENYEFAINKHVIEKDKSSNYLSSPQFKMLTEKVDHSSKRESDKIAFQEFSMNTLEFKGTAADPDFWSHRNYSLQSWDSSLSMHVATMTEKSDSHLFSSDDNSSLPDDCFLEDRVTGIRRCTDNEEGDILSLEWQNSSTGLRSPGIDESSESVFPMDYHKFSDGLEVSEKKQLFLQSCSSRRNLPLDGSLLSSEEYLDVPIDGFKNKRRRICSDEDVEILKVDDKNCRFDMLPGTSQQHDTLCSQKFLAHSMGIDMPADIDSVSSASAKLFSFHRKLCVDKGLESNSVVHTDKSGSGCQSLNSKWCDSTSDALFQATAWDVENFSDDNTHGRCDELVRSENYRNFADIQERDYNYDWHMQSKCSSQNNFISTSTTLDFKDYGDTSAALDFNMTAVTSKDISKFFQRHYAHDKVSLDYSDKSLPETEYFPLDCHFRGLKYDKKYKSKEGPFGFQDWEQDTFSGGHKYDKKYESKERHSGFKCDNFPKDCSRRSQSAPPFYKHKRRFLSLSNYSMKKEGNACDNLNFPETGDLKHLCFHPNYAEDLELFSRSNVKNGQGTVMDMKESKESVNFLTQSRNPWVDKSPAKGLILNEAQEYTDYGTKWRNGYQEFAGFLHLAGNSLVPESLHKNCLEDAKVLQQVDKKFIPIVASGTLAIIDQHAADERIRLEELRQKVLSGEARTVTYLDAEKELILPEMGHQLLQNYAAQIKDWGWICNIQAQSSCSFRKNLNMLHRQPTAVTLVAVPCILGVNLSDGDLLEFLQQLADTDGSSSTPQSVLRVLNLKACRGAIMFGDSLLPSECALIVEELKQTSLCFQCAHGRPTTVPLVNLEELHKQIVRVVDDGSGESWHGLRRQELSFERAAQRLRSAKS